MYDNGERVMAWIDRVQEVKPIEGADRIAAYRVGGWWVVDQKGKYATDDKVVYVSIDSWVPTEVAPFLSKDKKPRVYNGVAGERVKTIKLRGQMSQGLLLPLSYLVNTELKDFSVGTPCDECLGIQKWEKPMSAQVAGVARGNFPSFIPKTDQERVQNLENEYRAWVAKGYEWEVTEKLDGSSMTIYVNGDSYGVCSRRLDLKETEDNIMWQVARRDGLIDKVFKTGRNLALQGEIIGEKIQGNHYKMTGHSFYLYDIYDIDNAHYLLPHERTEIVFDLDIDHVPVVSITNDLPDSVDDLLAFAEGKSSLYYRDVEREGLVFKNTSSEGSFKAISNKYLLKTEN